MILFGVKIIMNKPIHAKKMLESKPDSKSCNDLPKLTVAQIVEKFVAPSTNRKIVQISEP